MEDSSPPDRIKCPVYPRRLDYRLKDCAEDSKKLGVCRLCHAYRCPSPRKACYVCVEVEKVRNPNPVDLAFRTQGLCEMHGIMAAHVVLPAQIPVPVVPSDKPWVEERERVFSRPTDYVNPALLKDAWEDKTPRRPKKNGDSVLRDEMSQKPRPTAAAVRERQVDSVVASQTVSPPEPASLDSAAEHSVLVQRKRVGRAPSPEMGPAVPAGLTNQQRHVVKAAYTSSGVRVSIDEMAKMVGAPTNLVEAYIKELESI